MSNIKGETTDRVFNFIVAYKANNDGNRPTMRRIRDALDIGSESTVHYHIQQLIKTGRLKRDIDGKIMVVGGKWFYMFAHSDTVSLG